MNKNNAELGDEYNNPKEQRCSCLERFESTSGL